MSEIPLLETISSEQCYHKLHFAYCQSSLWLIKQKWKNDKRCGLEGIKICHLGKINTSEVNVESLNNEIMG